MPRRKKDSPQVTSYSQPPETEVKLKELQDLYLQDKENRKVFEEFFMLIRTYSRSLTLKKIKSKGIFLPPERVDEICTDATLAVINQYNNPKEDWKVSASFAGVIHYKILEAMYKRAEDEQTFSLNAKFSDDDNSKEVMDLVGSESTMPWDSSKSANEFQEEASETKIIDSINVSYEEVKGIIDFAYDNLPYSTFMRFIPWLVLQFRKPKTRNIQSAFDRLFLSNGEQNAFDILFLEIHNRISDYAG